LQRHGDSVSSYASAMQIGRILLKLIVDA